MTCHYPAFPLPDHGEINSAEAGLSVLEYFAAKAPVNPQSWFKPMMPERPKNHYGLNERPPCDNDGKPADDAEKKIIYSWQRDPCFDLEESLPSFSDYENEIKAYWAARNE